ncbi:MAG: ABC transporter substrate-binding protein [Chloroflexi bacterium]|nr:ABC transporter substrate-binding protein [Chloroflexota bacterium]
MSSTFDGRSTSPRLTRRRWLLLATASAGALAAACTSSAPASPTAAPKTESKPTEAAKPAASPATSASPASSPAAKPAASPGASPAASPAVSPGASPAASPAAKPAGQAAPSGTVATAKPSSPTPASQVMNWFGQSSQGGFFDALKNGYYQQQNVTMTNEQGGPQIAAIPLVAAGRHTFGMTSSDSVLLAREEGVPIVMVFGTFQINPQGLMYHQSQPVKDFPDLNGRKVYVSGAANYWQVLSKKYHLDNVQQFQYNGQLATFLADEGNVFQCYVSSEPVILKRQGTPVGALLIADSGFTPYQNAMICLEKTIKEQPDLVQAYVTASLMGWRDFANNAQPTLEYIKSEFNKEYDLDIGKDIWEVEKNQFLTGKSGFDPKQVGMMTDARWKELYSLMRDVGVLKKDQDYKAAFNTTFIENAQKALG